VTTSKPSIPDDTAFYLIRDAVDRRRTLAYGLLHDAAGNDCAIGAFFAEHPGTALSSSLIDEVATVNDSVRSETPHERWKRVRGWLRWKVRVLAAAATA
jgi:hypothetical protein